MRGMTRISRLLPSPAMIVACIALAVALGGVSYAAAVLPKNSVGSAQLQARAVTGAKLKRNAVNGAKVKDATLTAADFRADQLPAGPRGPKGDTGARGPAGAQGEPATKLFAAIRPDGSLAYGSGVTASTRTYAGTYNVTFNRSLDGCVATADPYITSPGDDYNVVNHVALKRQSEPNQLKVYVYNTSLGKYLDVPVSVVVFC